MSIKMEDKELRVDIPKKELRNTGIADVFLFKDDMQPGGILPGDIFEFRFLKSGLDSGVSYIDNDLIRDALSSYSFSYFQKKFLKSMFYGRTNDMMGFIEEVVKTYLCYVNFLNSEKGHPEIAAETRYFNLHIAMMENCERMVRLQKIIEKVSLFGKNFIFPLNDVHINKIPDSDLQNTDISKSIRDIENIVDNMNDIFERPDVRIYSDFYTPDDLLPFMGSRDKRTNIRSLIFHYMNSNLFKFNHTRAYLPLVQVHLSDNSTAFRSGVDKEDGGIQMKPIPGSKIENIIDIIIRPLFLLSCEWAGMMGYTLGINKINGVYQHALDYALDYALNSFHKTHKILFSHSEGIAAILKTGPRTNSGGNHRSIPDFIQDVRNDVFLKSVLLRFNQPVVRHDIEISQRSIYNFLETKDMNFGYFVSFIQNLSKGFISTGLNAATGPAFSAPSQELQDCGSVYFRTLSDNGVEITKKISGIPFFFIPLSYHLPMFVNNLKRSRFMDDMAFGCQTHIVFLASLNDLDRMEDAGLARYFDFDLILSKTMPASPEETKERRDIPLPFVMNAYISFERMGDTYGIVIHRADCTVVFYHNYAENKDNIELPRLQILLDDNFNIIREVKKQNGLYAADIYARCVNNIIVGENIHKELFGISESSIVDRVSSFLNSLSHGNTTGDVPTGNVLISISQNIRDRRRKVLEICMNRESHVIDIPNLLFGTGLNIKEKMTEVAKPVLDRINSETGDSRYGIKNLTRFFNTFNRMDMSGVSKNHQDYYGGCLTHILTLFPELYEAALEVPEFFAMVLNIHVGNIVEGIHATRPSDISVDNRTDLPLQFVGNAIDMKSTTALMRKSGFSSDFIRHLLKNECPEIFSICRPYLHQALSMVRIHGDYNMDVAVAEEGRIDATPYLFKPFQFINGVVSRFSFEDLKSGDRCDVLECLLAMNCEWQANFGYEYTSSNYIPEKEFLLHKHRFLKRDGNGVRVAKLTTENVKRELRLNFDTKPGNKFGEDTNDKWAYFNISGVRDSLDFINKCLFNSGKGEYEKPFAIPELFRPGNIFVDILRIDKTFHDNNAILHQAYSRIKSVPEDNSDGRTTDVWEPLHERYESSLGTIEFMTSIEELEQESQNMDHCVRGYGSQCFTHQSFIARVRGADGNNATLELRGFYGTDADIDKRKFLNVVQNKSVSNDPPKGNAVALTSEYLQSVMYQEAKSKLGDWKKKSYENLNFYENHKLQASQTHKQFRTGLAREWNLVMPILFAKRLPFAEFVRYLDYFGIV